MELFKNRPLALGCLVFLVSLLISYFLPAYFSILLIVLAITIYVALIISYKISSNKRLLKLLIKISATVLLLVICGTVALITFKRDERVTREYIGQSKEIIALVDEEIYSSDYMGIYVIKIKDDKIKSILVTETTRPSVGDEIKLLASFSALSSDGLGYNEAERYRDDGIFITAEAESIEILSKENYTLKHHFKGLNSQLNNIIYDSLNEESAGLVSAMLLGNRKGISSSAERDFARLGISHVLSLSGMHLSLIAAMLSAFLGGLKINKRIKYLVMIASVLFFVMLTGFSESAVRSALMVIIFYTLYYFGMKGDAVSALFLSVTIICIFSPYLIFSLSLSLSFLAMLACMSSSFFTRRMRKIHRIRPKLLRNSLYVVISSIFVMVFTLPIVFLSFSSVSLLSPITNVVIVPFLTLLLYLSPFVLVLYKIPYLNTAISFICEKLTQGILFVTEKTASIPNIVISFSNKGQLIGIIIMTIGAVLIMLLSFERIKRAFYSVGIGALVFLISTVAILVVRGNEVSISATQYKSNDIIAIESNNELMIIECSNGHKNVSSQSYFYESSLGYNEIDTYLFSDYSYNMLVSVDTLTDITIIRSILLPEPQTDTERDYYQRIEGICNEKNVSLNTFDSEITFEDSKIYVMPRVDMGYRNAVAFRICANNSVCTYVSSNSRAVPSYFIEDSIEVSDAVIFGSYGPKYNTPYAYKAKSLDYVIFLGDSRDYCKMEIAENQIKPRGHRIVLK